MIEIAGTGRPAERVPPDTLRRALRLAGMRPLPRPRNPARIDLRGKRILITGASSGIGEAAAGKLADRGAVVILVARRGDLLTGVADRITARGGQAIAMPTDLSDLEAVDALVHRAGRVDVLVNNAGRSIRRSLLESLDRWHDVERTIALNYYAPLRLIRGIAPGMVERGDGHIINISSWRVMPESSPLFGVYNASKAALSAVSRVIDNELADSGVRSTTIYYPLVATPMIAPTRAYDGLAALSADEAADWIVTAAQTRPVRIMPRKMIPLRALDLISPRLLNSVMKRSTPQTGRAPGER
ncbi:SDR family oxidoreductase [Mycolicibacterium parafortuitum]|uniref:Putative oxidoreductase [Mycobacterium tuberculosis H37Rv] n=1 Tax=Mycolicibacterium parafortuitum TaxID=39692 RepID=A0A375YN07_MYCPF|nr:SDR family oxidoreductase [Mycolicibacterium parafortuitum]ORB28588.1 short-chain dehydrogenase [Mycolicibacterium parafortuitum]SRX82461.1 putative oxidoreductase [Mycobacterium tuberculosis H37Rv] [Mycolicibacterium parafortuitum]